MGNSLTLHGFDQSLLSPEMAKRLPFQVRFEFIAFEGSGINEWLRIVRHYLANIATESRHPEFLIIPYARTGLLDHSGGSVQRMAYSCDFAEIPSVLTDELREPEWGEFLHCFFSNAYANRSRVRQIVLERLTPDYQRSVKRLLAIRRFSKENKAASSYREFEQILELCRNRHVRVIVVPMPIQIKYDIEHEMTNIMERYDAILLDMRDTPRLGKGDFADATHMNKYGAAVFTPIFLERLMGLPEVKKALGNTN